MSDMDLMDRLLATARLRLPGSTQQALSLELFNTIDEFFRQSSAWRWQTSVGLTAGEIQYPIFPPAGSDLVQVMSAVYKGSVLLSTSSDTDSAVIRQRGTIVGTTTPPDFDALFAPSVSGSEGGVFSYSIFFPSYITLDIPPSEDAAQFPVALVLALTLNYQCLEDEPNTWPLDPWMHSSFHEAWLDGLQGRMMSQISKPYSNAAAAQYHMKRFRKFMGRAKQIAARGYVYDQPNWRFPQSYSSGRRTAF